MFDIGWSELLLIGVVALLVIGPKDLPGAIYQFGKWARRARSVAREFQGHMDDLMRQAELDELRKEASAARDSLDVKKLIGNTLDPDNDLRTAFDPERTGAKGSDGSPVEASPADAPPKDESPAAAAGPAPALPAPAGLPSSDKTA